jgi:hypothetical protein
LDGFFMTVVSLNAALLEVNDILSPTPFLAQKNGSRVAATGLLYNIPVLFFGSGVYVVEWRVWLFSDTREGHGMQIETDIHSFAHTWGLKMLLSSAHNLLRFFNKLKAMGQQRHYIFLIVF